MPDGTAAAPLGAAAESAGDVDAPEATDKERAEAPDDTAPVLGGATAGLLGGKAAEAAGDGSDAGEPFGRDADGAHGDVAADETPADAATHGDGPAARHALLSKFADGPAVARREQSRRLWRRVAAVGAAVVGVALGIGLLAASCQRDESTKALGKGIQHQTPAPVTTPDPEARPYGYTGNDYLWNEAHHHFGEQATPRLLEMVEAAKQRGLDVAVRPEAGGKFSIVVKDANGNVIQNTGQRWRLLVDAEQDVKREVAHDTAMARKPWNNFVAL